METWHTEEAVVLDPLAARDLVERHHAELYRYAFAMLRDVGAAEVCRPVAAA